jgi:hypothetical protein
MLGSPWLYGSPSVHMPQRGRKSWLLPTLSLYDLNWEKSIQISIIRGLNAKNKSWGRRRDRDHSFAPPLL